MHAGSVGPHRKGFLPEMPFRERRDHVLAIQAFPPCDVFIRCENSAFALVAASGTASAVQGSRNVSHRVMA